MNPSYESTSSSSAQPDVPPPTRTRWPPTPTVKACGSDSAVRRRNSGISCAELGAIEESVQGDAGGVERHLLAVDVVVAAAPAGEHEVTELHGAAGKQRVKLVAQRGEVLAHSGADGIDASRDQRSIGCRAALTSSTRRTGVSCGAACTNARSRSASATMVEQVSASWSRLCFDSVSVGANMRTSGNVVGKYNVGAYAAKSR